MVLLRNNKLHHPHHSSSSSNLVQLMEENMRRVIGRGVLSSLWAIPYLSSAIAVIHSQYRQQTARIQAILISPLGESSTDSQVYPRVYLTLHPPHYPLQLPEVTTFSEALMNDRIPRRVIMLPALQWIVHQKSRENSIIIIHSPPRGLEVMEGNRSIPLRLLLIPLRPMGHRRTRMSLRRPINSALLATTTTTVAVVVEVVGVVVNQRFQDR